MPLYRIELAPTAVRQLELLPRKEQVRSTAKLDALAADPRPPVCAKLRGSEDIYRIRVRGYRILYQVRDDFLLVLVVKVGKRGENTRDKG